MSSFSNPQLDLAFDFVQYTQKNIFLTGKAGTGKTTFLHNLRKQSPKRMAIVAPTGVAAINAGGVTIHSFFQLPFGPHIPGHSASQNSGSPNNAAGPKRFSREKINLIQSLDLLVIDEISMVRADMLDGIDEVLRRFRNHSKPFGGLQLLMIGDLHQLSPVIKDNEWKLLKEYYETIYFFSSRALQQTDPISIELKHIYRQSDSYFIDILNRVRDNQLDHSTLKELNERYLPDFKPRDDEGYITLTTHNATAQSINQTKLRELNTPSYSFSADIKDEFAEYLFPTEKELELKPNAQVMFVKNDIAKEKLYYNGKIGQIKRISEGIIYVKCPGDLAEIPVGKVEWKNIKYTLNAETKEVAETVIGTFTQYPLKLAWAITIHKSQGLTFDRAIIDANASFAHGQVYVALSRCKTFEGLVLRTPIAMTSVKTDGTISEYTKNASKNAPDDALLEESKFAFQKALIEELFDFRNLERRLYQVKKVLEDNSNILDASAINDIRAIQDKAIREVFVVVERFKPQLSEFFVLPALPEEQNELQDRIRKSVPYFQQKLDKEMMIAVKGIGIETDNKAVKQSVNESLENLQRELFVKIVSFKSCVHGFKTMDYLHAKANAEIDFKVALKNTFTIKSSVPKNIPNGSLYAELKQWRDDVAAEKDVSHFMVLPQKALLELVNLLPTTPDELESIKGIGKMKVKQFGKDILEIITDYVRNNDIAKPQIELIKHESKPKSDKTDTKKLSLDLHKAGWTLDNIAKERGLALSTIEGHLAHYIGLGEMDVFAFVPKEKVQLITDYFKAQEIPSLAAAKSYFDDRASFAELRFVMKHLEFNGTR